MSLAKRIVCIKNKQGVSPLIATILLIAFAVSLGAVVMNWTSGAIQEGSHSDDSGICSDVKISVLTIDSTSSICLDRENNLIVIDIENGPISIDGLRLSYLAKKSDYMDYSKKIEGGILSHIELGYDVALYGELNNVKIVPLKHDSVCSDASHNFVSIPDC